MSPKLWQDPLACSWLTTQSLVIFVLVVHTDTHFTERQTETQQGEGDQLRVPQESSVTQLLVPSSQPITSLPNQTNLFFLATPFQLLL